MPPRKEIPEGSWGYRYRIPGYRGILRISVSEDTVGILGIPRNPQDTIGVLRIRGILGHPPSILRVIPSVSWDTKGILGIRGIFRIPAVSWDTRYPQDTHVCPGIKLYRRYSSGYCHRPYPPEDAAGILTIPPIYPRTPNCDFRWCAYGYAARRPTPRLPAVAYTLPLPPVPIIQGTSSVCARASRAQWCLSPHRPVGGMRRRPQPPPARWW